MANKDKRTPGRLTIPDKIAKNPTAVEVLQDLTDNDILRIKETKITFDLQYLHLINTGDLVKLNEAEHRKELQRFIYEAPRASNNINDLISRYTSKDGSKISDSNRYVKKILTCIKNNANKSDPYISKFIGSKERELLHIHTKPNGKGSFVIFGFVRDKTFFVLAIDPSHGFDKR